MPHSFSALDFAILFLYLTGVLAQGLWLGRGNRTARDYFISDRSTPLWAILVSIVASETSALTFISVPGLAYLTNLGFLQIALGFVLSRIVVAYTLLPRYFEGEFVTAYAWLERRYGKRARRFASLAFLGTRAIGESVRVYATAIPVALIVSQWMSPGPWIEPASILILGLFTAPYAYAGGMKADIWTDVVQWVLYLLGAILAVCLIGFHVPGGWGSILGQASAAGRLHVFDLSLHLDRPHTLWAGLLGGGMLGMASHGVDQLIVQRLLASRNLKDAQRALIGSGLVVTLQFTLFLLLGVGLYSYFEGRPFAVPDQIFPRFIIEKMPPGLSGLLVAAILAATMGNLSSALNALSAASTIDIYCALTGIPERDPRLLGIGKRFTLAWAALVIGGAFLFLGAKTSVVTLGLSIASIASGILLGVFLLGIFWKPARERDAMTAMGGGLVLVITLQLAGPKLGWPWFAFLGTAGTFLIGVVSSRLPRA